MVGAIADKLEGDCAAVRGQHGRFGEFLRQRSFILASVSMGPSRDERYLVVDVVDFVKNTTGGTTMGVTGCSFGAYHAFTMALRHPDVFTSCITMGGALRHHAFHGRLLRRRRLSAEPTHFLPEPRRRVVPRAVCVQNKWVLVTGEHDICRADTERGAALLAAQADSAQPPRVGQRVV